MAKKQSKAVAAKKTTTLAEIQKQSQNDAALMNDQLDAASVPKVILNGDKTFTIDGVIYEEIDIVILSFCTHMYYYDKPFKKGDINPAACFWVGDNPKKPDGPDSAAPKPQAEDCVSCPMFVWGSDGEGKACKTRRVLAVVKPDATEDDTIYQLHVAPKGLRGFDAYIKSVVGITNMRPISVISHVRFDERETYQKLIFEKPVKNDRLQEMWGWQGRAYEVARTRSN